MKRLVFPLALASSALLLSSCAPEPTAAPEPSPAATSAAATQAAPMESPTATAEASLDPCAKGNLTLINPGTLTIGTDTPAYPPYFVTDDPNKPNGDPSSGQGFESAVAYAVADKLGFAKNEVNWVVVPFNKSYAPGDKDFDFDINQISINAKRAKAVDFSDGYYTVNQAVVAFTDSPIANATSIEELRAAKLGAQVGTTSLDFINNVVNPSEQPYVYNDTNDAKSALKSNQIDGIVVDLPTAYYITAVEFGDKSKIVGQFAPQEGDGQSAGQDGAEQFGLLFQKGNPLVQCVNQALADLKASGELQAIQDQWLAGEGAPYFKE